MIEVGVQMEVEQMEKILAELNAELGLNVSLCPEYVPGLSTSGENGLNYKLYRKGENPIRRLILVIDEYRFDYGHAKAEIRSEILAFWDGKNIEPRSTVKIIY
jgi:hypothetical protein